MSIAATSPVLPPPSPSVARERLAGAGFDYSVAGLLAERPLYGSDALDLDLAPGLTVRITAVLWQPMRGEVALPA